MEEKRAEVYDLLNRLGVAANYAGYEQTAYAIVLCIEQQEYLRLVTKRLYPEVAKQCGTNHQAVERNIRTVISTAWKCNRPLLERMAKYPLKKKPTTVQFLAILSGKLR